MGYLVCSKTIKPKDTDGYIEKATNIDRDILIKFIYNESREISDVKELTLEEATETFEKRLNDGNYYV